MPIAYLGIGSNIHPEQNLAKAAELLCAAWPDIEFSGVYKSAPRDHEDQADFLNAAAKIQTPLRPDDLLRVLQNIETQLGKKPPFRFGPRTIDLDLLLYNQETIHTPNVSIPHPRMHERRFVLEPLLELLNPDSMHPKFQKTWRELREETIDQHVKRIHLVL